MPQPIGRLSITRKSLVSALTPGDPAGQTLGSLRRKPRRTKLDDLLRRGHAETLANTCSV